MPVSGPLAGEPRDVDSLRRSCADSGGELEPGTKEAKRWDLGAEEPRQRSLRLRRVELSKGGQTPLSDTYLQAHCWNCL